jgi:predicted nucleotidyltransferase component of viral defense system
MLHFEILDTKRKQYLDCVKEVGKGFYLAGGTALALQLGHRDSVDFDFFVEGDIDTVVLWEKIQEVFVGAKLLKTQEAHNTLSCTVAGDIKLSFFRYRYSLVFPLHAEEGFSLAGLQDIGAMKLSAITSRASIKDYVDLYYILKTVSLDELLQICTKKFEVLDKNLVLKSLVYFEDILEEPIMYMEGFEVDRKEIEETLKSVVREYMAKV